MTALHFFETQQLCFRTVGLSRTNVYRCHLDFIKLSKITAFCCQTAQFRGGGSLATPFCVVNSSVKKVLFFLNLPIRSNNLLREPAEHFNGDDRDRTDNLCLARAALSQLSYVPFNSLKIHWHFYQSGRTWTRTTDLSFIRAAL